MYIPVILIRPYYPFVEKTRGEPYDVNINHMVPPLVLSNDFGAARTLRDSRGERKLRGIQNGNGKLRHCIQHRMWRTGRSLMSGWTLGAGLAGADGGAQADLPEEEPKCGAMGSDRAKQHATAELEQLMSGLAAAVEELGLDGLSEGDHDAGGGAAGRDSDVVAPGVEAEKWMVCASPYRYVHTLLAANWPAAMPPPLSLEAMGEEEEDVGNGGDQHLPTHHFSAWVAAAKNGSVSTLRTLLGQQPDLLDAADSSGLSNTGLHWAAAKDNLEAVRFLLAAGADTNLPNAGGATALHSAAANGAGTAVLTLLTTAGGCDPNATAGPGGGRTPREAAMRHGRGKTADKLQRLESSPIRRPNWHSPAAARLQGGSGGGGGGGPAAGGGSPAAMPAVLAGNPDAIVALASAQTLSQIQPQLDQLQRQLGQLQAAMVPAVGPGSNSPVRRRLLHDERKRSDGSEEEAEEEEGEEDEEDEEEEYDDEDDMLRSPVDIEQKHARSLRAAQFVAQLDMQKQGDVLLAASLLFPAEFEPPRAPASSPRSRANQVDAPQVASQQLQHALAVRLARAYIDSMVASGGGGGGGGGLQHPA
eukprot:SAG22_NODE_772_length_7314_cov_14.698545_5_plen_588_part_00